MVTACGLLQAFTLRVMGSASVSGAVQARNFRQLSDERLKENIVFLEAGLEVLRRLLPVLFTWKDGAGQAPQPGFLAQHLRTLLPQAWRSYQADF